MKIVLLLATVINFVGGILDSKTDLVCPPVLPEFMGICVEMCLPGELCGDDVLCCPNACGHVCVPGVTAGEALATLLTQKTTPDLSPQVEAEVKITSEATCGTLVDTSLVVIGAPLIGLLSHH
ncbi:hypothetical protein FOZ61_007374 [Perkinsus olseni]|uniref:WAP domain-containing protein n=1 Tax=Perkinsus olseni TaxID=32597 RepID=A0A7J6L353_PEROL|nr:hypothetical protein FOL46_009085 [Perkinsus olseni]KAF4655778.1 hypothetical protein FOZ61_007374 [Perkinsus olseni]